MYVKVIEKGCPICESDVKGNSREGYVCQKCLLIFRYQHLKQPARIKETITDNTEISSKSN